MSCSVYDKQKQKYFFNKRNILVMTFMIINIFNSCDVCLFCFNLPSYLMDIFSITYSIAHRNMYEKFIIFIGREVRLGWYLYASVKDLDLHPT